MFCCRIHSNGLLRSTGILKWFTSIGHVVTLWMSVHTHELAVTKACIETLSQPLQSCNSGRSDRVRHLYRLPDNHHGCRKGNICCWAQATYLVIPEDGEYNCAVWFASAHTICHIYIITKIQGGGGVTYGIRTQNATITMSLFLRGIRNFQTSWRGNTNIEISVAMSRPVMTCHLRFWLGHAVAFACKFQTRPSKLVQPVTITAIETIHCAKTSAPTEYWSLWWKAICVVRSSNETIASFEKHSAVIHDKLLTRANPLSFLISSCCVRTVS